jgi:hypothetical protein
MSQLTGRPLLDTRRDAQLFVNREHELGLLERAVARDFNVLLLGDRGTGKTSLLRRLGVSLRESGTPFVFIQGSLVSDAKNLLDLLRDRLGHALTIREASVMHDSPRRALGEDGQLLDVLDDLRGRVAEAERTVVLVDELGSPNVGHSLFGRLRDELWQLPFSWIVSANQRDRMTYLTPPADAFFDTVVELQPLSEEDAFSLLRARLAPDEASDHLVRELARHGDGNPRDLIALARDVIAHGELPAELARARHERDRRVRELGTSAQALVAELESRGPSSASDPDLLEKLAWTRARAVQVFRKLEEAGIVRAGPERGSAPGRPRKLYELVEPAALAAAGAGR